MIRSVSIRTAVTSIIVVSVGILLFLIWLIYFKEPVTVSNLSFISYLPKANAIFNSLSAFCLLAGYQAIRKRKRELHLKFMLSALTFSFLFLVSYLIYHTFQGDTLYEGEGLMRVFYFFILISHIILSAVVLPMILTTVYFAATGNFAKHPKIAKITLPLWLYVSVTGVMIYLILYHS